jgi:DNA repair protein RecN (Recombination protein N)
VLTELAVADLGVIAELSLLLGPGMTAITGETGAGKTLVVEAVELLVGGRADGVLVRPGADEARVEGRFTAEGDEVVLARVVPRDGRSRAYVNGRLATAATLAEWGARLVDLHGQHAHQSLLSASTQRAALDHFGHVDVVALAAARADVARVEAALAALGGDERARAREIDLLRFQVAELDRAGLTDGAEDERLEVDEDALADAVAHRDAGARAVEALSGELCAADALGAAITAIAGRAPFGAQHDRLTALAVELADVAADLRRAAESIEEDPERLAAVRERRQLLHDLRRKYGETLEDVIAYAVDAGARLAELESRDERAAALDAERAAALDAERAAARRVGSARRKAAPALASATQANLAELAMKKARLSVQVGEDPGDAVAFLLSANAGLPLQPLARVASGGELARAMLALRLVLAGAGDDSAPPTLVFDEVDAGVGGSAANAVGRALAALATSRQVLVVTHLPQVAAFADAQVVVTKDDDGRTTAARATRVEGSDRVIELSRMLSGSPESATAQEHAAELLAAAAATRPR